MVVFRFFGSAAQRGSKRLQYWLEHHPVASNSLLTLTLWVAGDSLAQYSEARWLLAHNHNNKTNNKTNHNKEEEEKVPEEKDSKARGSAWRKVDFLSFWQEEVDWDRTAKCASFGALVTGPVLAVWYPYLDRWCLHHKIASRFKSPWGPPIVKVLADEFLMDPPMLAVFFGYMSAWEKGIGSRSAWESFQAKMETQFLPSWATSLALWPWVLLGTFRFLPVHLQAPVINVCCIAWDAFLSHRNILGQPQHQNNHK